MSYNTTLVKKTLANGLVVIVDPIAHLPQVAMQLTYHVGSKDEKTGEKGLAHLIEHMLFKGTDILSETDVAAITHKISGSTNAFTNQDCTSYVFSMPSGNWKEGLKIYADCMNNACFDEQMLNSELKAVIQELKMRKDNHQVALMEALYADIFHDHPYHYPIIGIKQDLWNLKRDTLYNFYKKHYVPNNAVLVVVGDVNPDEVFMEAEELFGSIPTDTSYAKETFYHGQDLQSKSVTLRRDVKVPHFSMMVTLPGGIKENSYFYSCIASLLTQEKTGRLTQRIVEELRLAPYIYALPFNLEDAAILMIGTEPYSLDSIDTIKEIIHEEIEKLSREGSAENELQMISRKIKLGYTRLLENYSVRAHLIAEGYTLYNDQQAVFTAHDYPLADVNDGIKKLLKQYYNSSSVHYGTVLPFSEADKERWKELQAISDTEDFRILDGKVRTSQVEEPRIAPTIISVDPSTEHLPLPESKMLSNGVKLFSYHNKATALVTITITFKARADYDDKKLYGLHAFMVAMLTEGTTGYPGIAFFQECQKYSIVFGLQPGIWTVTVLPEDIEKALELLRELLTQVTFNEDALEKVRARTVTMISQKEQDPQAIVNRIIEETVYAGHPWSTPAYGTHKTVAAITKQDLHDFYKKVITHDGMRIAVVGNSDMKIVEQLCEKYVGDFYGQSIDSLTYPALAPFIPQEIKRDLCRDQVTLAYFCPSIRRLDDRYDSYTLLQNILGGGMNSRLFQLRQQSGLFYGIQGYLTVSSDIEPGYCMIQTLVSQDRVQEADILIRKTIDTIVDSISEQELADAKKMLITQKIQGYANNTGISYNILHNDRFGFAPDYNNTYSERINSITFEDFKRDVSDILCSHKLARIQVGRVK